MNLYIICFSNCDYTNYIEAVWIENNKNKSFHILNDGFADSKFPVEDSFDELSAPQDHISIFGH